jgi:hypothetical protein
MINIYIDGLKVGKADESSMPFEKGMEFEYYHKRKDKFYFRTEYIKLYVQINDPTLYKDLKKGKKYELMF